MLSGRVKGARVVQSPGRAPLVAPLAPKIVHIGALLPWMKRHLADRAPYFIAMTLTNNMSGVVDIRNGTFEFLGQD